MKSERMMDSLETALFCYNETMLQSPKCYLVDAVSNKLKLYLFSLPTVVE